MSKTFVAAGTLKAPMDDSTTAAGAASGGFDLACSAIYTQKVNDDRNYDTAVVNAQVDLGSMVTAGAKLLFIKVTAGTATVRLNTITDSPIPLALGGYMLFYCPTTGFPKTLYITTTGPAIVSFLALA